MMARKNELLLQAREISLLFGATWLDRLLRRPLKRVFQGVNFELLGGESVALTGGNGSGKSSILRLCAGLYLPTAGQITPFCPVIWGIGNDRCFYERLTLEENLAFFMRFSGLSLKNVQPALERVGLLDARAVPWREASTGMRARLVMARSFVAMEQHRNRAVLLLDEPERGLDAAGMQLLGELGDRICAMGGAVFTATHLAALNTLHFTRGYRFQEGALTEAEL